MGNLSDTPIKDGRLEESLLSRLFSFPDEIGAVRRILIPQHFGEDDNAEVYRAMLAVPNPDFDSVLSYLDAAQLTDKAGGYNRLEGIRGRFGLGVESLATAQMIREIAWRRDVVQRLGQLSNMVVRERTYTIADCYRAITHQVSQMGGPLGRNIVTADSLANESIEAIKEARNKPTRKWWRTGFALLDELFGYRYGPGMYALIVGPTNIGKTNIASQLAAEAAAQGPTLYVSLESGSDDIWNRMLAAASEIPVNAIYDGSVTDEQHSELLTTNGDMHKLELEIVSDLNSAEQIEQYVADMTVRYGFRPGMVFVDNIDNLADMNSGNKRYERLTPTSNMLLTITRRTGWGVVGLKQMNIPDTRGVKQEALHGLLYPTIYSIEGARTVAQHASFICGMYSSDWIRAKIKAEYIEDDYPAGAVAFSNLKSRHSNSSAVTEIFLGWDDKIPRFYNVRKDTVNLDDRKIAGRDY